MKIDLAIEELHRSEGDLTEHLLHMSDRHKVDHEVFHLCRDLARLVAGACARARSYRWPFRCRPLGRCTGARPPRGHATEGRGAARAAIGARTPPTRGLASSLPRASGASLDWEILAQTAQAAKESELLELAERLHPETLRQAKWANAKLKESSAQIMVS